ncbi:adenine-specific DNA-methyltransferase [Bathymodiolus platifrons methanotrophic gill symbiont]|uniref:DNA methyltransferase n=1 Tax=Bathymodiolus platifrons methanotrophic gill symbiont TaxID=113268 RepID=UPI000B422CF5|nr:site-specific DNA-methyltransferase [Bathymodiolus platifrons methanotrophic gill symbiont]GAW87548.1 adenine-specific DNA-methyltransferase [Bathymodiolus platifrons methanotrophic gill symbiont]GFO76769.1 adenine-specific DNA-methyltransferase [Bathymodiolus platifrons methanotrophic gill symbiont]
MQNLLQELIGTLQNDERLVIDGRLVKNKVVELALAMDEGLISLLLGNESIKKHFFKEIGKALVFDKVAFQSFVSNKQFLPDSYTAFKNKIGLTADREYLTESKEVVLSWAYKDCVLEGGQTKEDQKRKEIFWNETLAPDEIDRLLAPKALSNFKKYDKDGEHKVDAISLDDNLIIKGNNLLALHSLKNKYAGKVKLIYIDPPYNTGSDSFGYNDSFNHSTWLTFMKNRLEIAKELLRDDGVIFVQCDDSEQAYLKVLMDSIFSSENHINTISIKMKNVAGASGGGEDKKLKKNIEYLHVYAKNYLLFSPFKGVYSYIPIGELVKQYRDNGVSWKYTTVLIYSGDKGYIGSTVDGSGAEIKIYSRNNAIIKSINQIIKDENLSENDAYNKYAKKIFQTAMPQSSIRPRVMKKVNDLNIVGDFYSIEYVPKSGKNKGVMYEQFYKGNSFRLLAWLGDVSEEIDGTLYKKDMQGTLWDFVSETNNLTKEGSVKLLSGKKPEKLLQRIIEMSTDGNDLILDFHLGSGTTCAVAHKMGRRYIGVEQLNYDENDSFVRLNNVIKGDKSGISKSVDWQGGGSFTYCELTQHNANIIDKIEQEDTTEALKSIWQEIEKTGFISYKINPETINENIHEFEALTIEEQKQFLIAVLDKNQLYVNYSEIEDEDYQISDEDKKLNKQFYGEV